MKKQKTKIILFLSILIIIVIFLKPKQEFLNTKFQDELIFFKLLSLHKKEDIPTYYFRLKDKTTKQKDITLLDSVKQDTLIREKIAPRHKRRIPNSITGKQKNELSNPI